MRDASLRMAFVTRSLRRFRKIATNPMWNQTIAVALYENDQYHRFDWGAPPASSAVTGASALHAERGRKSEIANTLEVT